MHSQLCHTALMCLNRLDRLCQANVPQANFSAETAWCSDVRSRLVRGEHRHSPSSDQFAIAASLHVRIHDPRVVPALVIPDHVVPWRESTIIHFDTTVAKASDQNIASDLIACESGQARVGSSGKVLSGGSEQSRHPASEATNRQAHLQDRLARGIPYADVLDITAHERLPSPLLPFNDQACILLLSRGWNRLRDALERRDELDIGGRLVMSEQADVSISFSVARVSW